MANRHGNFIWYELMTRDPEAAKAFYEEVVGWTIGAQAPGDMDYRLVAAGDNFVGGVFHLTEEQCAQGARPAWLGYIGVDDVDATVAGLTELGGKVLMPAFDIPDVGRIAMVADPQGTPFYVMRGAVEGGVSTAFKPQTDGHCGWNELATTDQSAALSFYGQLFGWESKDAMSMGEMGEMGEYKFLDHCNQRIGAVSPVLAQGASPAWTYYFQVADIDTAAAKTGACGGKVIHGPHEVPGDQHIIIGLDLEGVVFALVGPRTQE